MSIDQPKTTFGIFKKSVTMLEIFLSLLFAIYAILIMFLLLLSLGTGSFLVGGQLLLAFVGLMLAIKFARQERTSLFPTLAKSAIGFLVIFLSAINSYILVTYIDYFFARGFLSSDSALYFLFVVFVITLLTSLWYFLYQKFPSKYVISVHSLLMVSCLIFFVLQLANVRKQQALVLKAYQDFALAIRQGEYETAYQMMSPNYREQHSLDDLTSDEFFLTYASEEIYTIFAVGYNFWRHDASIVVSDGFEPTFWDRPQQGVSLDFEFIDGKWQLTGQTGFYLFD